MSPEIVQEVCARLSKGEPLTQITADAHMPCDDTVRNWAEADETGQIARDIARARETGFDAIALDALAIADRSDRDWEPVMSDGVCVGIKVDGEHVSRAKLMVDTRLKLLAKWDPKRYGERVTHQGDENAPPVQHALAIRFE